jgi:hypothetical protein
MENEEIVSKYNKITGEYGSYLKITGKRDAKIWKEIREIREVLKMDDLDSDKISN